MTIPHNRATSLLCVKMNCRTELAEKLSLIVDHVEKDTHIISSEFTADDEQFVINSIRTFITTIGQYPNDHTLTCADIIHGLNLKCHPEGGFYQRFSWTKQQTKTFYLLPSGCVSSWHSFNGITETWKWLYGGKLNVSQISNDCRWLGEVELAKGKDVLIMDECGGTEKWGKWFGAYHKDDDFTLAICECTPAFEFSKFKLATEQDVLEFVKVNPARMEIIERLTNKNILIVEK